MKSNWDKYLDPPDEPEAELCESCGQEKSILDEFGGLKYMECTNPLCPEKHSGIAKEIAEKLAEANVEIDYLRRKIRNMGAK